MHDIMFCRAIKSTDNALRVNVKYICGLPATVPLMNIRLKVSMLGRDNKEKL